MRLPLIVLLLALIIISTATTSGGTITAAEKPVPQSETLDTTNHTIGGLNNTPSEDPQLLAPNWNKTLGGRIRMMEWSPDNNHLAVGTSWGIVVYNKTGAEEWRYYLGGPPLALSWSAQNHLATARGRTVIILDENGRLINKIILPKGAHGFIKFLGLQWDTTGTKLAVLVTRQESSGYVTNLTLFWENGTAIWSTIIDEPVAFMGRLYRAPGQDLFICLIIPNNLVLNIITVNDNGEILNQKMFYGYMLYGNVYVSDEYIYLILKEINGFDIKLEKVRLSDLVTEWNISNYFVYFSVLEDSLVFALRIHSIYYQDYIENYNYIYVIDSFSGEIILTKEVEITYNNIKVKKILPLIKDLEIHVLYILNRSNNTIRVWNIDNNTIDTIGNITFGGIGFAMNSEGIIGVAGYDGRVYLYNNDYNLISISNYVGGEFRGVVFNPSGSRALIIDSDYPPRAFLVNLNGDILDFFGPLKSSIAYAAWSFNDSVYALAYLRIIYISYNNYNCYIYFEIRSAISGRLWYGLVASYEHLSLSSKERLLSFAWSHDNSFIIIRFMNNTIRLNTSDLIGYVPELDVNSNSSISWFPYYRADDTIDISRDDRLVVISNGSEIYLMYNNTSIIWHKIFENTSKYYGVHFSPNSSVIAVTNPFNFTVVRASDGGEVLVEPFGASDAFWDPLHDDTRLFVLRSDPVGRITVYDSRFNETLEVYIENVSERASFMPSRSMDFVALAGGRGVVLTRYLGVVQELSSTNAGLVAWNGSRGLLLCHYDGHVSFHTAKGGVVHVTPPSVDYNLTIASGNSTVTYTIPAGSPYIIHIGVGDYVAWLSFPHGSPILERGWGPVQDYIENLTTSEFTVYNGSAVIIIPPDPDETLTRITLDNPNGFPVNVTVWTPGGYEEETRLDPGNVSTYWSVPGEFTLKARLPVPDNFIGNESALTWQRTLTLPAGSSSTIVLPGYNDIACTLAIMGSPDADAIIKAHWDGGTRTIQVPQMTTLTLWAAPGAYTLEYNIKPPSIFAGNMSALNGTLTLNAPKGASIPVQLPGYDDLLGAIVLQASDLPANITLSWENGNLTITLPSNENIQVYAAPGTYILTMTMAGPPGAIGEPPSFTRSISIEPGSAAIVNVPGSSEALGLATIIGPGDVNASLTINWENGNKTVRVTTGSTLTLYAYPGNYTVTARLEKPAYSLIRDSSLIITLNLTVEAGKGSIVSLPPLSSIVAPITVTAPRNTTITISGLEGSLTIHMSSGATVRVFAEKGFTYTLGYTIERPTNYVGTPDPLSGSIEIGCDGPINISLPRLEDVLGILWITTEAGESAPLQISWSGGSAIVMLQQGESLQLWAAPGSYTVAPLNAPTTAKLVGPDPVSYYTSMATRQVTVAAGESVIVEIPGPASILSRVRVVKTFDAVLNVTISWPGASVAVEPGELVLATPGVNYTVRALITGLPGTVTGVGPLREYLAANPIILKLRPEPSGDATVNITLQMVLGNLSLLTLQGPPGVIVRVSWAQGSLDLHLTRGSASIVAVPGLPYDIYVFQNGYFIYTETVTPGKGESTTVDITIPAPPPETPPPAKEQWPTNASTTSVNAPTTTIEMPKPTPSNETGTTETPQTPSGSGTIKALAIAGVAVSIAEAIVILALRRRG